MSNFLACDFAWASLVAPSAPEFSLEYQSSTAGIARKRERVCDQKTVVENDLLSNSASGTATTTSSGSSAGGSNIDCVFVGIPKHLFDSSSVRCVDVYKLSLPAPPTSDMIDPPRV